MALLNLPEDNLKAVPFIEGFRAMREGLGYRLRSLVLSLAGQTNRIALRNLKSVPFIEDFVRQYVKGYR